MYIPKHYLETDHNAILAFMKKYSFATLITAKDNIPFASHLPFVISETGDGIQLHSHVAKANPQWQDIEEQTALVIFSEPHAYISPRHYESEKNVPTWNYIAVHAYGKPEIIHDHEKIFDLLESMIDTYETAYKNQWNRLPADYRQKMANGIVAFSIKVENIEAKKKLSQNKKQSEQENILNALSESNHSNERAIAEYMKARRR